MNTDNIEDIYGLSPMQQGMLFHSLYAPRSGVYCVQFIAALSGSVDPRLFKQAWQEIIDRHAILRTAFFWEDLDKPLQVVRSNVDVPLEIYDWRALTPAEDEERLENFLKQDRERGFDLSEAPLMRLALIHRGAGSFKFVWSHHHLLLDGWSASLLFREFFTLYLVFERGEMVRVERSRPYRDYIAWLQQQDLTQAETFWRQLLKGFTAPTPLIKGRSGPAPSDDKPGYDEQQTQLSETLTSQLQELAREHRLTLNTLAQGVWAVLLSRYSSEEEVLFGTTTSGRPPQLAGSERMVGLFINTLPVRVRVRGEAEVIEWLQALQEEQAVARQYEYSPLVDVQGWSEVGRGLPLFESIFVFENYPVDESLWEQKEKTKISIHQIHSVEQTNYPLSVIAATGRKLTFRINYERRRFDRETIKRMLEHLEVLLAGIVADASRRLRELPLLSSAEKQQIVYQWNETKRAYPAEQCLHELFEEQVARTPAAIAVVYEEERVSYRELNERANRLAHQLRRLGVKAETPVGVLMERSVALVVALLGVLKAGGAYVPLDPEYPEQRLSFMAADAGLSWLLTEEKLKERITVSAEVQRICVAAARAELAGESSGNVGSEVGAENLAYVIYTSGSTGRPKGVMISHRAISNRLHWMQQAYELEATEAVLQKTTFSFDVSVWEFFWPLLVGARLVMARPGGQRDGAYLAELMVREGVTTTHFVPSQLGAWLEEAAAVERGGRLQRVICSGEALSYELQERFHGQLSAALHNLYGPTEAAVDVTSWACERGGERAVVPIGRPISNLEIYILDQELGPVPVGVVGELYIGGVGLSRGYLQRAALTAERFVPHPYSSEAGARLYRTGDLARYLVSGEVEYVGRADGQVKVKGHRIELGEVEAALIGYGPISDCAVVAREGSDGQKRLVAYVTGPLLTLNVREVREYLRERLPEYMIPSAFIELEALPLTASGKLDRKALPAPESQRPLENAFTAPYTRTEELLVEIWSEVLKVEQVGVDDDFFELGGDSILSLQIGARARLMGLDFSIQELFGNPTIRKLARKIDAAAPRSAPAAGIESTSLISEDDRVKLPGDVEDAYPLVQLQAGMIFHSEYRPETAVYHDIFTFHIEAHLEPRHLKEVLQKLVARHPVLRTSFDLIGYSEPLQLIHRMVDVPFEVEDLRHLEKDEQERFLSSFREIEKGRPFDWKSAPLLRFHVHRRTEESFQFTLSFHHAILDGWSVASMLTEIFQHYAALVSGKISLQEPSPPSSLFRDFVALERATLKSEESRRYWSERLRDSVSTRLPRLPSTHESAAIEQTRTLDVRIPAEVFAGLKQLAWSAAVPLKSVLLAAHLRVMSLLSGRTDILTGLVSNGRPEVIDGERVLGLFLNTLPFRFKLSGGSWADLVRATFDAEQELLAFRRYPMAQIQREQSGRVLFETGFNFNHFHVYKSLPKVNNLRVVGGNLFESTNYTLSANFGLDAASSSQLQLVLSYNAGELKEQQVTAFGSYYAQALSAMASDPDEHYESVVLLSSHEQQQILHEWNGTRKEYSSETCLHELFEQQAERTPKAIALVCEDEQLSYVELNQRANQLAHHLRILGVREDTLVGVLMERSVEMVVALLGILKAGGAYVPLDPEYPQQRLSWMVEDSGVRVLLTQERLMGSVALDNSVRLVCVDTEWKQIAQQSGNNVRNEVSTENLAYVIYTSGSTGRPNAVLITHRSPCNIISDAVAIYDVRPESRVLQIASLSFDAAVLEIFLALTKGARLYVATAEQRLSGQGLARLIEQESITTAVLTPSTMRMLAESELTSLKVVSSGGERCSGELASQWARARRLLNCYGPTEATVFATYAECDATQSKEPPIGRPIANTEIYILDTGMHPVPVGVTGELYIGGDGLARSYLRRPDLTAERFLPHPFSAQVGARLYRTGDIAKYSPSGEVEYVGRIDEQVKVRGYRIELGELEAALREHEGVSECVVVAREEPDGEQRLVAYVVAAPERGSSENGAGDNKPGERDGLIEFCPSVAEYFVYDDLLYHTLTNDVRRNDSYKVAISQVVRDKVVLDIGTGPEAILARFCVEAGARKVYAIEVLEETYQKAVACVRRLGLEDKIILVHGDSTGVQLPEKVDVCVSEIVGSIGGSEGAVHIVNDARRFMKDGGLVIPWRSMSRVAAVQLPDELLKGPAFTEIPANYVEKLFEQVGHKFDLRLCIKNFPATHLISDIGVFEDLDFSRHIEPAFSHEINLTLHRDATLHGFLIWLNLYPTDGELIDTLQPGYSWFPMFFPVFHPGINVFKGETIRAICSAWPSGNHVNPDYRIEGTLFRSNGETLDFQHDSPHHEQGFRRTPFYQWLFPNGSVQIRNKHTEISEKSLKTYLRQCLPGYMTPHAIVLLDELPLTPTGKVDRRALPASVETRPRVSDEFMAPRTPVEERLAAIWSQLLGIEQISVHDNFFDLGGHSLLATQLITRVREAFRVELPLRDLFEAPVLHKLGELVERAKVETQEPEVAAIAPLARSKYRMSRAALGAQSE